MSDIAISFQEWRTRLLADAQRCGCEEGAQQLTDTALNIFWKSGVEPTVRAVIEDSEDAQAS
jgi:hypothetical protein